MTEFYNFRQNNSGGSWEFDETAGLSVNVIIEADSKPEAIRRAESIGIYFDGCSTGRDCSCCGDRWDDYVDADAEPSVYGAVVHPGDNYPAADEQDGLSIKWFTDGVPEGFIHYLDGRIESFWADINERQDLDGKYGWGLNFGAHWKNPPKIFIVGKNGWDETGNSQAPSKGGKKRSYGKEWEKPDTVTVVSEGNWIMGWFPTEDEAKEYAEVCLFAKLAYDDVIEKWIKDGVKVLKTEYPDVDGRTVRKMLGMWKA